MRPYLFTCLFLFLCLPAHGRASSKASSAHLQETGEEKDPIAILKVGAAQSWNFSGGAATFAPNLAAEVTPIENWLELEAGVSPFYIRNSTEWDTDLLFSYHFIAEPGCTVTRGEGLAQVCCFGIIWRKAWACKSWRSWRQRLGILRYHASGCFEPHL
jgi:hypothetical protein